MRKHMVAALFAWWIFLTAHPSQPLFGPYASSEACMAAVQLRTDHQLIDCRPFEVKP